MLLAQVPGGWKASKKLIDVIDFSGSERRSLGPLMPQLTVRVDDLAKLTEKKLASRAMPETAKLALMALRHARDRTRLDAYARRLARWITALPNTDAAREMLLSVISYSEAVRPDAGVDELQAALARVARERRIES